MPELPEVETVRRSLLPLEGARIAHAEVRESRLRRPVPDDLSSRLRSLQIETIDRRGKYLLFGLSNGEVLLAHLGMTGTLILRELPGPAGLHDHVRVLFQDGRMMIFNDPRRFGILQLGPPGSFAELQQLGPDPFEDRFDARSLYEATRNRRKPLKNLLMDQSLVAGIGNIYANETLFRAGIRPTRPARRLRRREADVLHGSIRSVLSEAISLGGSSISDFRDGTGRPGYFQLTLNVYDREGLPCLACGTIVRKALQAGRSSFYCTRCQR